MKPIYIGQEVPVELLIGEPVGTMQLFINHNSDKNLLGISNEGKCIKPAILKRAILLNKNFFVWENDNGAKSIANKGGQDIALNPGHLHYIAPEHIVSLVVNNSNPNNVVTTKIGTKADGTKMTETEVSAYEDTIGYQMSVDLSNDVYNLAEGVQIIDSDNLFNKEKSAGMSMN